jgi:hypothetical protein
LKFHSTNKINLEIDPTKLQADSLDKDGVDKQIKRNTAKLEKVLRY